MSKLIPTLAAKTGLREGDIRAIILNAAVSYKHYRIAKRTGGWRDIAQPAREVKHLQRLLVKTLELLPIHDAAMAYRTGVSIRQNALCHAASGPILKYDFSAFFPSIRASDWENYCLQNNVFSDPVDIQWSSRLLFHRAPRSTALRLAIGAPSSPWLSNVLMFEFDRRITESIRKDRVIYTRYADDLTFSAPRTGFLNAVDTNLRRVIREIDFPRLKLNEQKTVMSTKKYRRVVTGLVLANDGRVSLGRDRKRLIRAELDYAFKSKMSAEDKARLAGVLAFAKDIEPEFFHRIAARYGGDVIRKLSTAQ